MNGHLPQTLALITQTLAAIVGVVVLWRVVYPRLEDEDHTPLVLDVWGPLAIALPGLFAIAGVDDSVRSGGWLPLAAPALAAWVAFAATLVVGTLGVLAPVGLRSLLIWSGTGLFLLLLAAAHRMTVQAGQCALAVGAVLLWLNTPSIRSGSPEPAALARQGAAGLGMVIALVAAVVQGLAMTQIDGGILQTASTGVVLAYMGIALCAAAGAGGAIAVRLGGWTATFAILFGLGVLALMRMIPVVSNVVAGEPAPTSSVIAGGFGALAPEAMALIILGPSIPAAQMLPRRVQLGAGALILAVVAAIMAWRLAEGG